MKSILCLSLFLYNLILEQNSIVCKSAYAGGYIVFSENATWHLEKVFINSGDAFSIQVSNTNFKATYHSGDTLHVPFYIADMELLTTRDMVQYTFYFQKK
jgi:hypothetical protein